MRTWFTLVAFVVAATLETGAQPNSPPVRLALVASEPQALMAADLLTVELSKKEHVQLLERTEIERVYREQGLPSANVDYRKLGQVLGADGLLLLEMAKEGTNQFLTVRLVAVKPGVILGALRTLWPVMDAAQWARWIPTHFGPLFPKFGVLLKDAVPISVVNLRSAVRSPESQETERQLTLLAIERLTRQRELFVLERRRMDLLAGEKELKGLDESAFWNGSYLLDGVIDRDSYSKDTVSLIARLTPPRGGAPLPIELSGSRTNLPDLINRLGDKVTQNLKLASSRTAWNPADEAEQYFDEAKWAFRWRMWHEAQAACESSWALGRRTKEVADLRIRSYREEAVPARNSWAATHPATPEYAPDINKLAPAIRAVQLYERDSRAYLMDEGRPDTNWYTLSLDVLLSTSELLRQFYYFPPARQGHEQRLEELRLSARETAQMLSVHPAYGSFSPRTHPIFIYANNDVALVDSPNLATIEAGGGTFWCETPEQGVELYRELAHKGFLSRQRRVLRHDLIGWTVEDEKRAPAIWREFIQEVCSSTNPVTQVEGFYQAFAAAKTDREYVECAQRLFKAAVDNAPAMNAAGLAEGLMKDIEDLYHETNVQFEPQRERIPWNVIKTFRTEFAQPIESSIRQARLDGLKEYLRTNAQFDCSLFESRFLRGRYTQNAPLSLYLAADLKLPNRPYTEFEARELLPLVKAYRERITEHRDGMSPAYVGQWYNITNSFASLERELAQGLVSDPPASTSRPAVAVKPPAQPPPALASSSSNVVHVTRFWSMPHPWPIEEYWPFPAFTINTVYYRAERLWFEVRNGNEPPKAVIFGVSLSDMKTEVIELPLDIIGLPRGSFNFDVMGNFLYYGAGDRIKRYSLRAKTWEDLPTPTQGYARLTTLNGRLFVSTVDSIIEITKDGKGAEILASSRRRPALSVLDSVDGYGHSPPPVFLGPSGSLRTLIGTSIYTLETNKNQWSQIEVPAQQREASFFAFSDQAAVFRFAYSWLLLPNDESVTELLLTEPAASGAGVSPRPPFNRRSTENVASQKPRWIHPLDVALVNAPFCLEGETPWFFAGDLGMRDDGSGGALFKEQSGRHALLLEFKKNAPQARMIPLWFDLKTGIFPPVLLRKIGGFSTPTAQGLVRTYVPGRPIFQSTPHGIVVTAENVPGFWLIPWADLEPRSVGPDPSTALLEAAEAGDLAGVNNMLARGAAVDARNYKGWTSLILAVKAGNAEMVRVLVENGADVNTRSTSAMGSTVLCFAAETNNAQVIRELLKHGVQINATSGNGLTALYVAAIHGNKETAEALLSAGVDPDAFGARDASGRSYTPLMGAACDGELELVELLLSKGAKLERTNNFGATALMEAAKRPHTNIVKYLIAKQANVNAAGPHGHTALIYAAYNGQTENIKLLLAAGADPNATATEEDFPGSPRYDAAQVADQQRHPELAVLIKDAQGKTKPSPRSP